jgi:hypothetical protein
LAKTTSPPDLAQLRSNNEAVQWHSKKPKFNFGVLKPDTRWNHGKEGENEDEIK